MRGIIFLSLIAAGSVFAQPETQDVPVVFDTFQSSFESRTGWQNFGAAYAMEFIETSSEAGPSRLKVKARFSQKEKEAKLIWRFPDVQCRKFVVRAMMPRQAHAGDVFLRVLMNDTRGDAYFFNPYVQGTSPVELPCWTLGGMKIQKASPLPVGKWITYTADPAADVFYLQKKQKAANAVQDMALMNTPRDALNIDSGSRPAMEAVFISFQIKDGSPLINQDVEFYLDCVEIY